MAQPARQRLGAFLGLRDAPPGALPPTIFGVHLWQLGAAVWTMFVMSALTSQRWLDAAFTAAIGLAVTVPLARQQRSGNDKPSKGAATVLLGTFAVIFCVRLTMGLVRDASMWSIVTDGVGAAAASYFCLWSLVRRERDDATEVADLT